MTEIESDKQETQEWLDALASTLEFEGSARTEFILEKMLAKARTFGLTLPTSLSTPYINTLSVEQTPAYPGNLKIEKKIESLLRWNAMAMVLRAGKISPELGGHIATYASASTLYEVGFNHFFHASTPAREGDLLYIQGHASPGIYARAFLEGRLTQEQLTNFRQEIQKNGLSSYPHPWLMPEFWQFATVSMGLGPLQSIYQARFLKYLKNRELADTSDRKIWVFCGDGEMDEPESLGAISLAGREKLDNLIFVINCNLQRLDGPVRGNGKIIQELEAVFRGAGWNVIKVIWGCHWDPLLQKDDSGLLTQRMNECVDGEYQAYRARNGAYIRERFFGKYSELKALVENLSDEEIWQLNRGGHDPVKVYAAYKAAVTHTGQPTVILAKTIKGYGMGLAGEAQNITHQQKKIDINSLKQFRDRFQLPLTDEDLEENNFCYPDKKSEEIRYLLERRHHLGGFLPARRTTSEALPELSFDEFKIFFESTGDRKISTTMAFVRILSHLLKDKVWGPRIVPIVPDEARTFGMEGLFRQIGIYSSVGQLYAPVDASQIMYYREDQKGQMLEEGITEPGSFCSWIAAGTSYSVNNLPMIPFYIYYSMFGFQRIGDLAWAAGDMQTRGFLLGATSGRTSLAGEGLQHQDGHNHVFASVIPNCICYDPTYAYELAVIIREGMRRMFTQQENIFYYISIMNENYEHPGMPAQSEEGILKGMYLLKKTTTTSTLRVQLLGSGSILRDVIKAADILKQDYNIAADIWSVTSFTELRREAACIERENLFHPNAPQKESYITQCFKNKTDPVIAATDYIRLFADQIRPWVPTHYVVLGTDGYGRSDTRTNLRDFFEVSAKYIVLAALKALADTKAIPLNTVKESMEKLEIDPEKPNPFYA
ncbi:MAG: pyruvate dehydrogenase (acetyl-transferring), homodimeric type [Gammaproteobacteria bacterium RIFCSPHIGHO2_02_FULL_38_33]|nr:MAG: pyruvate dehydrogenase (acetyl-transferring), homodimeric type [Gammaproteobacteria bacterium RIFCSPHIGHO2_02_FULL_38_33]